MRTGISYRKSLSTFAGLGIAILIGSALTSTALAITQVSPMQLDLRNGTTDIVAVTSPTQLVNSEFWAVVADGDANLTNDKVNNFAASVYSATGPGGGPGIIYGDMALTFSSAFQGSVLYDSDPGLCYAGTSQNLDGDGDNDIGSTNNADVTTGWIFPSASLSGATSPLDIGQVAFQGTGWVAGSHGVTQLFVVSTTNPTGTGYKKDNVGGTTPAVTGRIVTLYRPATAVVGGPLTIDSGETKQLGGTGSTGTFDTWEWIIGGLTTSLTGDTPDVSYDYLVDTLHLTPGNTYDVQLNLTSAYEAITPGFGENLLTIAPEPATLALLAFGGLAMLARRRRSA